MHCCSDIIPADAPVGSIKMGVWDTLNVKSAKFDISRWVSTYGEGQLVIVALRPGESIPYEPTGVSVEGGIATWTFDETDTAVSGYGSAALAYYVGGDTLTHKARSVAFTTFIAPTISVDGAEPPDPLESWYEKMLEASAKAQQAAGDAEDAADRAEEATVHAPIIGQNGNWWTWDQAAGEYTDTGTPAGGSGSSDYEQLRNKPKINDVTLVGSLTLPQLGINIPAEVSDLTNDADYQSGEQVETAIRAAVASLYKPGGTITFAELPQLTADYLGFVYDISTPFTTTADFVEGAGISYPAGTDVAIINAGTASAPVYKYDVFPGMIDLSGYLTTEDVTALSTAQINAAVDAAYVEVFGNG